MPHPVQAAGQRNLVRPGTGDARQAFQVPVDAQLERFHGDPGLIQDGRGQAALLVQQGQEQVLDVHLLVPQLGGQPVGGAQGFLRFLGKTVTVHQPLLPGNAGARGRRRSGRAHHLSSYGPPVVLPLPYSGSD